eukprot:TRINITY_DN8873_c0_g1_i1.p1 TRINITY_DN8873_c0_g1~~TRINITY_DN8873_c0_g1_i1.p1  ORF type:complete len:927 (+),score=253.83 TRINITY_DN8873_c0_g1_i1:109-2889(+)
MPGGDAKRKFKVVFCSSEYQKRPVRELYTQGASTKGWQSEHWCEYPQELGFQFESVTSISQIQFLSHQHKIASKIELFIGSPDPMNLPAYGSAIWKRLGYLSLDSNSQTNYKARELKSVHVQATGLFLKVLLHKCHLNSKNIYAQVGLVAVNIIGRDGSSAQPTALPRSIDAGPGTYEAADSSTYDSQIVYHIKQLNRAKIDAIEVENYELAKKLKYVIEQLKSAGVEIANVERDKLAAVAREDFDSAVAYKRRIDAMRAEALRSIPDYPGKLASGGAEHDKPVLGQGRPRSRLSNGGPTAIDPFPPRGPTSVMPDSPPVRKPAIDDDRPIGGNKARPTIEDDRPIGGGRPRPTIEDDRPIGGAARRATIEDERPIGGGANRKPTVEDERPIGGGGWKPPPMYAADERPPNGRRTQTPPAAQGDALPQLKPPSARTHVRSADVRGNRHFDDEPLPALNKRDGAAPLDEYPDAQQAAGAAQKQGRPEPIPEARRQELHELLTVFGDDIVAGLISKTWTFRESAIKEIDAGAARSQFKADQEDMVFRAYCRVLERGFSDKITNVYYASLRLLLTAFQNVFATAAKAQKKLTFNQEISAFVGLLLDKTGDTNSKTKELSLKSALFLAKQPSVGPSMVLQFISAKQQKKDANWRSLAGKLDLLTLLTQAFGFRDDDFGLSLGRVMEFIVDSFENTNPDVRTASLAALVEAHRKAPDAVRPFVQKLKPAAREPALKKLQEADAASDALASVRASYDRKFSQVPGTAQRSVPQSQPASDGTESTALPETDCQFCGTSDPTWDSEAVDSHMMTECPMLYECPCDQVIEVHSLNEHWFKECDHRDQFERCPTCSAAIRKDDLAAHTCTAPPNADLRCPLCQKDLEPQNPVDEAWKRHLTEECPRNPRSKRVSGSVSGSVESLREQSAGGQEPVD